MRAICRATTRASCARPRVAAFVDDVVDLAAERVERGDRAAPLAAAGTGSCNRSSSRSCAAFSWQYSSGVMQCALQSQCRTAARAITAWAVISSQSRGRSTGRGEDVVAGIRDRCVRMRSPPAMVTRISSPMRPGGRGPTAAPIEQRARARRPRSHECAPRASLRPLRQLRFADRRSARVRPAACRSRPLRIVDRDVLPGIDELQRRADRVRSRDVSRCCAPYRCSSRRPTGLAERRQ